MSHLEDTKKPEPLTLTQLHQLVASAGMGVCGDIEDGVEIRGHEAEALSTMNPTMIQRFTGFKNPAA